MAIVIKNLTSKKIIFPVKSIDGKRQCFVEISSKKPRTISEAQLNDEIKALNLEGKLSVILPEEKKELPIEIQPQDVAELPKKVIKTKKKKKIKFVK
jgi:hypothetical protein